MQRVLPAKTGWLLLTILLVALPADALAEKTLLRLRLNGPVLESPGDSAGLMAIFQQTPVNTLREWVKTIRDASADGKINGLVLVVEEPQLNLAQVEELSRALRDFSSKGKPVYAYLDYGSNLTYGLAASADYIALAENSELAIVGLQAELMFFKGLLDKIGVTAQMMHCGAYKSALEPFTRTEPSPEAAENINWLLDGMYERWTQLIADGRKLPVDEVRKLIDQAPLTAEKALAAKLVDEVSTWETFTQTLRKKFGQDVAIIKKYKKDDGLEVDFNNPFAVMQQLFSSMMAEPTASTDPGLGLIYIAGPIMVGKSDESPFGGATAGSTTIRAAFDAAREDESIKAVVVRVDSPGGSALASDIIWNAATRCAKEKPVIVSMGNVAGSGGYYVAIPGETIFAEASTITGSIGVVGGKLVWDTLMESKLGITTTAFARGKHAGLMSMSEPWTEAEFAFMQKYMDDIYAQFKGRVKQSRGERIQGELEDMAGGRVFTGAQALKLGLVDKLGGLSDALDYAAGKGGLGADCRVQVFPKPSEIAALFELLEKLMGGSDGRDEFEVQPAARIMQDPLLRSGLPLVQMLAPDQAAELLRALQNLLLIQRERVGCFMTFAPRFE